MSGWEELELDPNQEATNRRLVLIREQADMIREWYSALQDPIEAYMGVFEFPRCNHTWESVEVKLQGMFEMRMQCSRCFQVSTEIDGRERYADGGRYRPYVQVDLEAVCGVCWDIIGDLRRDPEKPQNIKPNRSNRSNAYLAHINSEKWRSIRRRILGRAGWVCEGCLTNKATEVHHMNYLTLGDELCYDLRALCPACHDKADNIRKRS